MKLLHPTTAPPKAFNVHNQEELDKLLSYLTFTPGSVMVSILFLKLPIALTAFKNPLRGLFLSEF